MNKILSFIFISALLSSCAHMGSQQTKNTEQTKSTHKKEQNSQVREEKKGNLKGNRKVMDFNEAKRLITEIQKKNPYTIYCHCRYEGKAIDLKSCDYQIKNDEKRASRLEWEHVVPAENFGRSFVEWRKGIPGCSRKGRQCARENQDFNFMEADLYNLWPEVGELNGLRSNYNMAELTGEGQFGGCKAKIEDRKFEPMDFAKGRVARVYMYMNSVYPQADIISDKNRKLFDAWDKMYPVDAWECERTRLIEEIQGNSNDVVLSRCKAAGL